VSQELKVLHVEDSEGDAILVSRFLKKAGYDVTSHRVDTHQAMVQALNEGIWDIVLCDHSMPNFDTASALEVIIQTGRDIPMVIVSGAIDEKVAVAAMRAGVRDYVMKDALGRLVPVVERELLARQVRARKREAEQAVADQVSFLNELIETIPAAIFYKDKDGVYLGCNRVFARLFGKKDVKQIKGLNIFDVMSGPEAFLHNQMDTELLAGGGQLTYETSIDDAAGARRYYMVHKASFADAQGDSSGIVGVLMEITKLKKAEEARRELEAQLRQAQKLEAIGTLAGGIAHDFNNILAAISGYCELALYQTDPQNKLAQYLEEILVAGDRAKSLVSQILTFSRKSDQEIQSVNVALVAKEALKLLRSTLPPSIEMEIDVDAQAGLVSADPTQVHQIFMNLCTNAAHAMKEKGGALRVGVRHVEVSESDLLEERDMQPGPYLEIVAADNGQGMSQATLDRVFDPYFTTKAPGEGTGLGLAVVHGIIKSMGGSINVQSELGEGSTFRILIPVAEQEEESVVKRAFMAPHGDERVLVVDDEPTITELLKVQLGKFGYKVTAFDSGDKAWAHFENNPDKTDAVITDMLMRGMQGDELLERIKCQRPAVPVIVYTGFSEYLQGSHPSKPQADAVFLKPTKASELAWGIRQLLDQKKNLINRTEA
jgi:PAS domain S-box-containing protein